jgi:RND superfamily putative drug exporter
MSNQDTQRLSVPDLLRRYSVLIAAFWLGLAVVTNVFVPQLEKVAQQHNVSLSPQDAPSLQASKRIGQVFHEFDSDSSAMIVLEGDRPLGADAHHYYDALIRKLTQDTKHVEHIQDFWGDPLTAAGSQSADGKAALVQVFLAGNQGESLANASVDAVRNIVNNTSPPPGVQAYVTGGAPLVTDQFEVGSKGTLKTTLITIGVILVMLLVIYRRVTTAMLVIFTVMIELTASRGVVAVLANAGIIGLSTYSTNILTLLVIAAGTDYAIFILGRYHEARLTGQHREAAFATMYSGTAHVILGSGLTIAGAVFCLHFTRLPYFQTMAVPAAAGVVVALVAALTLAPAVLSIGRHFGLFEPARPMRSRGWRRIGTAIVRWPGPVLVVTIAIALIGLLALPGYETSYDTRPYMPADAPANIGYAAAGRHFSQARLNPELLMIDADHDLRNSADMIVLERVAKAIFHTKGIAEVQSITRPLGTPLDHSSIPFQISAQSTGQIENLKYQQDRGADLLKQADQINTTIGILKQQYALQHRRNHHHPARRDRHLRRLLQTAACVLLLGATLFQHSGLRSAASGLRRARRYRRADRSVWADHGKFGSIECASTEIVGAATAPDRPPANQSGSDSDELRHHVGDQRSGRGRTAELHRHGASVRRSQKRRLLLPATGGIHQLRIPAGPENVSVAGWQGGAHDHHP